MRKYSEIAVRYRQPVTMRTDAYALRLFRDGQLVARWPTVADDNTAEPDPTLTEELDAWRRANRIVPDSTSATPPHTFPVRLAHRDQPGPVMINAYAFNEDRVKSSTARFEFAASAHAAPGRPRAYLIAMGVSASEHNDWNLKFAAADARLTADAHAGALQPAGRYDVVPLLLTSEAGPDGKPITATTTKGNLRAVLDLLAGGGVQADQRQRIPSADHVRAATPDDLVLLSFSGHGYACRSDTMRRRTTHDCRIR